MENKHTREKIKNIKTVFFKKINKMMSLRQHYSRGKKQGRYRITTSQRKKGSITPQTLKK